MQFCRVFCQFYRHAEQSGEWPTQMTAGRVVSLAKCPLPQTAADFRPITVLSLGYRLWSSYHSRNLIAALDDWLPTGLHGSRVGGHAGQVWHSILLSIEESHDCGIPLTGLVGDIVKAFNCLSRPIIFELAGLMQLPAHVLTGWAGCTMQMARHFEVRQSLSPATMSVTGFAEGDGLSVLAMILLDCLLHWWMGELTPIYRTLSYVDDWQLLVRDPMHIGAALDRLEAFCALTDLQLDRRKTYVWSLSPGGRKDLRQTGLRVAHAGRNLGAHLQLTKQHTNQTLQTRVNDFHDLWDRLRLSPCPYPLKTRALVMAAWPRGLHGIASTGLGHHMFRRLRAGAMRGLQADGAGCSPWIQLGMIEHPVCDPLFWSVLQTIRCVRDCAAVDFIQPVLTRLAFGCTDLPANTITQTLLSRLQCLGWSVRPDGQVEDCFGPFCLFATNLPEIDWRAQLSWQAVVSQQLSHRAGFANLHQADLFGTRKWIRTLSPEDAGLGRKLLNGAHFTQEAAQHWQTPGEDLCQFCQCSDSRYHRFWQCDAFAKHRVSLDPEVWAQIPTLPEYLTCYGWGFRPASWIAYHSTLVAIEESPHALSALQPAHDGWIDLFTDGSCHFPTEPWRLASWAVIQACSHDVSNGHASVVLAASALAGVLQSAFRAEVRAVLEALRIAHAASTKVRLWCDCNGVVVRVRALLGKTWRVKPNGKHSDLWEEIRDLLDAIGPNNVVITKVAAHQDHETCVSGLHQWCFLHNSLVDHAAKVAHLLRSHNFWKIHDKFRTEFHHAMHITDQVRQVLMRISRDVVYHQRVTQPQRGWNCSRRFQRDPVPFNLSGLKLRR